MELLIVDDDKAILDLLQAILTEEQHALFTAECIAEAETVLRNHRVDLIILDLLLPDGNGLDFVEGKTKLLQGTPVVLLSGHIDIRTAVRATRLGVADVVEKRDIMTQLVPAIEECVGSLAATQALEPAELPEQRALLGVSPPLLELYKRILRAAQVAAPVLIEGETGSGKELVAQELHRLGTTPTGPFVAVNCTTINTSTFESELFGHMRGSFTGADRSHTGIIRQAQHGTLLLDEIGELALEIQPKLLRALQERELRPVGATETVPFDVRFLFSTNRDLEKEVQEGRFRPDLFFRISALRIEVPPLRARPDDIIPLFQHFLRQNQREPSPLPSISEAAEQQLRVHNWPGNVRELQNLAVTVTAFLNGPTIDLDILPEAIRAAGQSTEHTQNSEGCADRNVSLAELEQEAIESALERNQGSRRGAARELGISEATLYRRLRGLRPPAE